MHAIHIIKNDESLPSITPIEPGSNVYRSGYWAIAKTTADALIGAKIHFHEQQTKPSFYGGIITGTEKIEQGERAGRIVFTFRFDQSCKGVTTSRDGWSQEIKIIP
jgi:hypothetical protein